MLAGMQIIAVVDKKRHADRLRSIGIGTLPCTYITNKLRNI